MEKHLHKSRLHFRKKKKKRRTQNTKGGNKVIIGDEKMPNKKEKHGSHV